MVSKFSFSHLAIDWGQKRSGLAFGDQISGLIIPYQKELQTVDLLEVIFEQIKQKNIQEIIIGLPTNFSFEPTLITNQIWEFIKILQKKFPQISIKTVNERNSTKQSKEILGKVVNKHNLNHQAACQILSIYFDKNHKA
jgi:putative transcription antitermination factor YqgF